MPNLAIATELRSESSNFKSPNPLSQEGRDGVVEILYVGSRLPLDCQLVETADIPFKPIFAGKLRRYFSWRNFVDPIFVILGFFQSLWILIRFWPHAVFTKGGFVSIPVALAAFILRRPIVLHESDSVMGLSNRIVSKLARKVCVAFPDVIQEKDKLEFTGNPIRLSVLEGDMQKGYQLTGFNPHKPVLLVWGGSQGAQEINEIVEQNFSYIKSTFQIIHITGYGKQTSIQDESYIQFEYLGEELKHIYAITDLVVGRSGANSLYELALMQKPNILIPLKSSAHNHQQLNAEYFEKMGASLILRNQSLHDVLTALWHNPEKQERMKEALADVAKPDAAAKIAELILSVNPKS